MRKILLGSWLLSLLFCLPVLAQDVAVSGRVTSSDDGSALPGVTIQVKGTTRGTTSDVQGNYRLNAPANGTLVFSYIGYTNQEATVGNRTTINVALVGDSQQLSEVVVTGYGTQQRRDVTGSVGTIKGDGFKNIAVPSFDKYLQGQVAGVQASVPGGMLGQAATVRIRGTNSISNGADPLYVVDGLPYITGNQGASTSNPYNPLGDINPNDIESVEVLKDGSATAIYGSRAANGVILITTKKGKKGAPRVSYDGWLAVAEPSKRFDLMNANEFITVANEKLTNAGLAAAAFPTSNTATGQNYDTNWQDVILRKGFQQNHALSFSGATDQTNYYFSLGYANLEGNVAANNQTKYSFRARVDQKAFKDKVTFGMNAFVTHTTNTGLNQGTNALSGNIAGAIYAFPNVAVQFPDGSYNIEAQSLGRGSNTRAIYGNYTNQKFILDNNIYKNQNLNLTGNAYVDVEIVKGLNAKSQIGINYLSNEDFVYQNPDHGDGVSIKGSVDQTYQPQFRYNWQNTLSYNRTLGQHKIGAVVGYELQKTTSRYFESYGYGLSDKYFGTNGNIITGSLTNQQIYGSASQRAFESYFARANYSYGDRYLISATVRQDKISSLPIGNQAATLPGISVGWRLSEESFLKSVSFLNELKLRGSYAQVGNVEIGNYPYAGVFAATQYGDQNGIRYNQVGNNNLKFETSNKVNFGVDASFFSNRISITAEYFRNNIDNLILQAPTPPSLGVPGAGANINTIAQNIGKMKNQGFEFSVSTVNFQRNNFSWRTNFNVTFVNNKILQLVNGNDIPSAYNILREGEAIGSFFGYVSRGVNASNGNPIFEKADGSQVQYLIGKVVTATNNFAWAAYDPANPSNVTTAAAALTQNDKKVLGVGNPTWYGGFNNSFNFGNFDASLFLTFAGGNKIYNITRQEQLNNQVFANAGRELLNRWTADGQVTDVPKLYFNSDANVLQTGSLNSRFLEDGKFLRVQNISLGYTLPTALRSKIKANTFRIYVQVQNAHVFTKYKGLDPELNGITTSNLAANAQPGLDNRTNPVPRTYTVGLNLNF
ncbi:SusC/RagA family TonB-linked outer membrane protein [Spirosoma endophyticum]|uniref:TonB-linked outer membrane protein, SusC/RagA family n=1 Tax=Spirosoma endophyticum TaxID=662367 RepID=A0A1I1YSE6_9BACT|nr:TonB-dependent receptor [Spirosoma endophyticum]SFE22535.1 TonB-linked outer membrane protein, SusC/RagA family [Spirosoma endophyticum]